MSTPASELQRIVEAIEAGEELTLEQRRAVAAALRRDVPRFAERDALIVGVRSRFFHNRADLDAAHEIAAGLNRYASTAWLRDRSAQTCPARIAGTEKGAFWQILKVVDRPLSAERIRKIVGQFEMTNAPNDRRGS
ncbi:hypothetical protein ACE10X_07025 [Bradyrhizobium sp. Pha-3]|uniref:hypothetical protein n=1 Tax=Bradyrhizobium sp. Pha-3 TaxID=208375 RepID=UPI0035D488A6